MADLYPDAPLALLSVKTLGKDPTGSEYLSSPENLSTLLDFAKMFKDEPEASSEALRCIANALLLIDTARSTFINKVVDGGETCILLLEVCRMLETPFISSDAITILKQKSTAPDRVFILSRILFLATASGTSYIQTMVETKHHGRTLVEILGNKLDTMTTAVRNGTPNAKEAVTDLLKFIFNILVHYPKVLRSVGVHGNTPGSNLSRFLSDDGS